MSADRIPVRLGPLQHEGNRIFLFQVVDKQQTVSIDVVAHIQIHIPVVVDVACGTPGAISAQFGPEPVSCIHKIFSVDILKEDILSHIGQIKVQVPIQIEISKHGSVAEVGLFWKIGVRHIPEQALPVVQI